MIVSRHQRDVRILEVVAACLAHQLARTARSDDAALIHGDQPVELARLVHVGRRYQDRDVLGQQLVKAVLVLALAAFAHTAAYDAAISAWLQARPEYADGSSSFPNQIALAFDKRLDPRGNIYYWMTGELELMGDQGGTDLEALQNGYVAITPIGNDGQVCFQNSTHATVDLIAEHARPANFLETGGGISRELMRGAMERVAAGDYETPVPGLGRHDEIGELSQSLNGMAAKLSVYTTEVLASVPPESRVLLTAHDAFTNGDIAQLQQNGMVVSARVGHIRISPHCYNTEDEIDAVLEAITAFAAG